MNNKYTVLKLLENTSNVISGQSIAESLGISRAAVWKHIHSLQDDGYAIISSPKGYSLDKSCDVINADAIKSIVGKKYEIEVFDTIDSTNNYIKNIANESREGKVVIAKNQSSGKGRLGRSFFSPDGSGIYMSILLKPKMSINDTTLITAMSALAVCEAIYDVVGIECPIKWVNDIYHNDKKLCGILCEAGYNMELANLSYVVVGIGINVYEPKCGFPDEIKDIATGLLTEKSYDLRNRLISKIIDKIFYYYNHIHDRSFVKEYKNRCFVLGKNISVINNTNSEKAKAIDIDEDCRLLVEYDSGEKQYLNSGEISIRL